MSSSPTAHLQRANARPYLDNAPNYLLTWMRYPKEILLHNFLYLSPLYLLLQMMLVMLPSQWTWNEVKSWFLRLSNNQIGSYWHLACKIRRKQPFSQTPCQIFGRWCRPALLCYFPRFELFFIWIPFQITGRELYIAVKFGGFILTSPRPMILCPFLLGYAICRKICI